MLGIYMFSRRMATNNIHCRISAAHERPPQKKTFKNTAITRTNKKLVVRFDQLGTIWNMTITWNTQQITHSGITLQWKTTIFQQELDLQTVDIPASYVSLPERKAVFVLASEGKRVDKFLLIFR